MNGTNGQFPLKFLAGMFLLSLGSWAINEWFQVGEEVAYTGIQDEEPSVAPSRFSGRANPSIKEVAEVKASPNQEGKNSQEEKILLARTMIAEGRVNEGLALLEELLKASPENNELLELIGYTYLNQLGDRKRAEPFLRDLLVNKLKAIIPKDEIMANMRAEYDPEKNKDLIMKSLKASGEDYKQVEGLVTKLFLNNRVKDSMSAVAENLKENSELTVNFAKMEEEWIKNHQKPEGQKLNDEDFKKDFMVRNSISPEEFDSDVETLKEDMERAVSSRSPCAYGKTVTERKHLDHKHEDPDDLRPEDFLDSDAC